MVSIKQSDVSFSSMLDIGKLIPQKGFIKVPYGFSSMLDIGKLIRYPELTAPAHVLAQCWI